MLRSLVGRMFSSAASVAVEKSLRDRCIETALEVLQSAFDEKEGYFYHSVSQKEKDDLRQSVISQIVRVLEDTDPVSALRLLLVNYAIEIGNLAVLSNTPAYAMFSGISGELRERVAELTKIDDHVRNIVDGLGVLNSPQAEMVNALNGRAHFLNLPLIAFNAVRINLGDWDRDPAKDWFRPLSIAYQIHIEDSFRMELGMPSILENQSQAIVFSGFASVVLEGHHDPRAEWERRWMNIYNKPSPFHGVEL